MKTDLWNYLKYETDKPIVLYGMGNGADRVLDELERIGVEVKGVFASDDFVRGQSFRGFTVKKYSDLEQELGEMIILVCFGSQRKEVIDNIKSLAQKQELYCVDVPVFGEGVFNYNYYEKHKEEIDEVFSMLADEKSRQVYKNIIDFKLTGNINCLFEIQTTPKEAYENILRLNDNETYIDLGAFNGDTISEFIENTDGYRKIYAVEPDKKSFKRLIKNTENLKNIELFNVGISDKTKEGFFNMQGGRNSAVAEKGKAIQFMCVDDIIGEGKASYIKFDVEGEEKNAISGAEKTIKRLKPKMLVSAYHRVDDIFSLPLQIKKIRNDYKVFIRHYEYLPAWDTAFYFI
ncbi:MAG: FkbM family methyltransferase [Clostridiales bacterium]|nr:FkbM family methyltransferase [Clostridiales bacterium]